MTERKHERVHTRKIDRAVARQRMKEDGYHHAISVLELTQGIIKE